MSVLGNSGENLRGKDIGQAAKTLEQNIENAEEAADDEDDVDEAPIFTPELARLRAKEAGMPIP